MENFTIDDCNIDIPEDADGLFDRHDERSTQVDFHQFNKAQPLIVARPVSLLAGFLSSHLGLFLK